MSAVARDLIGLRYTPGPVTVKVFNDTTPPTIRITSPAPGSTVAGTISVSADASDNVGVAAVRFKLDGADSAVEGLVRVFQKGFAPGLQGVLSYVPGRMPENQNSITERIT